MDPSINIGVRTRRRRTFGGVCLLGALAMLLLGEFVLSGRLSAVAFLWYWFACFVLTMMAIFTALIDLRAMSIKSRILQRELVMDTLRDIERKKQADEPDDGGAAHDN
jgi:hypothetical protein